MICLKKSQCIYENSISFQISRERLKSSKKQCSPKKINTYIIFHMRAQLIFSTLMMILTQYGSLLIAASCESGIKSHFYGTFNKPQWLFIEKQSTMGSKPLKSSCIFTSLISSDDHNLCFWLIRDMKIFALNQCGK